MMRSILMAAIGGVMFLGSAVEGAVLTKSPDFGPYWFPLSGNGTYVYANSFVAPDSGTVSQLGIWLLTQSGAQPLSLQVLGSLGGNPNQGPDVSNIIATTAPIAGANYPTLTFVSAPTVSSSNLVAGQTYWFAGSTIGLGSFGAYQVGAHTQNSAGIIDFGTFWYSNSPDGSNFDGRFGTPEMAFEVTTGATGVPEPSTLGLAAFGLIGAACYRRRATRA